MSVLRPKFSKSHLFLLWLLLALLIFCGRAQSADCNAIKTELAKLKSTLLLEERSLQNCRTHLGSCTPGHISSFQQAIATAKTEIDVDQQEDALSCQPLSSPKRRMKPPITETGPNYTKYPISFIPLIGPAGSKVMDPDFGTEILRLTDGSDGSTSCNLQYSYWPVFNKDSTRAAVVCTFIDSLTKIGRQFLIERKTRAEFFEFHPSTFTFGNRSLPKKPVPCL